MAKVRLRDLDPAKFLNKLEVDGGAEIVGSVGVGTGGTVTDKLEVVGAVRISNLSADKKIHFLRTGGNEFSFEHDASSFYFYNRTSTTELFTILNDGKIGIGQSNPTEMLTINSASNTRILLQEGGSDKGKIAAGGSGLYIQAAAGRINFRNTSDADTVLIEDTGYVGMIAAAQIRLTLGSQGTAGTNDANWIRGNGTQLEYNSASSNHNWEVGGSAKMRLDSTGRLGIGTGTDTLGAKLEVHETGGNYNAIFSNAGQASVEIRGGESSSARLRFLADEGDDNDGADHFQLIHQTNNNFEMQRFNTTDGWKTHWALDKDGNVGIGTGSTAPTKKLEINAGDILLSNIGLNKYGLLFGEGANQTMGLRYDGTGSNGNLEIVDGSNNLLVNFEYDGKVGIGVDSASIPASYAGGLNVNSKVLINSNLVLRYGLSNGNNADFYHNGETLTIRNTGTGSGVGDGHILLKTNRNVGIGSFSGSGPTYNLHVEGSMYANTITVGTGFNDLINAGQLTARKSSSGNTADTDATLVVEDSTNAILEFLTQAGNGGTINFSSNKKGVCQIKAELPNKLHFYAGEAHQLTLNQSGSNNVNFSKLGAGTVQSDSSGNLSVSSSAALKTDVQDFISGLSSIINLRPVKFKWKEETGLDHHNDYVGFIAEEVEEELPDAVLCPEETCTPDGEMVPNSKSKGLSDRAIIAALVNSVIELNTRIEQLENN